MTTPTENDRNVSIRFQIETPDEVQIRTVALGIGDEVAIIAVDEDEDGDMRFTITAGHPLDSLEVVVEMLEFLGTAARAAYEHHVAEGGEA